MCQVWRTYLSKVIALTTKLWRGGGRRGGGCVADENIIFPKTYVSREYNMWTQKINRLSKDNRQTDIHYILIPWMPQQRSQILWPNLSVSTTLHPIPLWVHRQSNTSMDLTLCHGKWWMHVRTTLEIMLNTGMDPPPPRDMDRKEATTQTINFKQGCIQMD